ncbi:hypothetical protein BDF14DRAFT_1847440 [Spinellus fusiger]|nr:hypothetical protein BDF14DRAFT_1847440 [Spinellus fusiger]
MLLRALPSTPQQAHFEKQSPSHLSCSSSNRLMSSNTADYSTPRFKLSQKNVYTSLTHPTLHAGSDNQFSYNSTFLSLEKVVQQYSTRPELLELILSTKVEEDRRRAEEAKLRRKEIDYLLQRHQTDTSLQQCSVSRTFQSIDEIQPDMCQRETRLHLPYPRKSSYNSKDTPKQNHPFPPYNQSSLEPVTLEPIHTTQTKKRHSLNPIVHSHFKKTSKPFLFPSLSSRDTSSDTSPVDTRRKSNSNNIDMLLSHSPVFSKQPSLSNSYSSHRNKSYSNHRETNSSISPLSHHSPIILENTTRDISFGTGCLPPTDSIFRKPLDIFPSKRPSQQENGQDHCTKRKRREMQAITTIIETRDFPYNDNYLWKNNGNTVHKKTGNKSIYYKCSNSGKGCLVNKTVTFRENGEHLIKYRGQHLKECSRIKHIVDI